MRKPDYTKEQTIEMAKKLAQLMEAGYSLTAAAGKLKVYRQRVYEWAEKYPEVAEIVDLGRGGRLFFLETKLLEANTSAGATSAIFALKNASPEEWRDKKDVEHSGKMEVKGFGDFYADMISEEASENSEENEA